MLYDARRVENTNTLWENNDDRNPTVSLLYSRWWSLVISEHAERKLIALWFDKWNLLFESGKCIVFVYIPYHM